MREHVRDRAGGAQVAAVLGEDRADGAAGAVAVVGQRLDDHGDAAGPVAFVADRLVVLGVAARRLLDGPLDVVLGHVLGACRLMARRRRAFISGSGMPVLAATVISRASLANSLERAASWRPLRCMMFLNWEWPAMRVRARGLWIDLRPFRCVPVANPDAPDSAAGRGALAALRVPAVAYGLLRLAMGLLACTAGDSPQYLRWDICPDRRWPREIVMEKAFEFAFDLDIALAARAERWQNRRTHSRSKKRALAEGALRVRLNSRNGLRSGHTAPACAVRGSTPMELGSDEEFDAAVGAPTWRAEDMGAPPSSGSSAQDQNDLLAIRFFAGQQGQPITVCRMVITVGGGRSATARVQVSASLAADQIIMFSAAPRRRRERRRIRSSPVIAGGVPTPEAFALPAASSSRTGPRLFARRRILHVPQRRQAQRLRLRPLLPPTEQIVPGQPVTSSTPPGQPQQVVSHKGCRSMPSPGGMGHRARSLWRNTNSRYGAWVLRARPVFNRR